MPDKKYYVTYPGDRDQKLHPTTRSRVEEVAREWYVDLQMAMDDLHETGFLRTSFAHYHYLADDDPRLAETGGHTSADG